MQTFDGYVRKKDFKVALNLPCVDAENAVERARAEEALIAAIYLVKPSFLYPRLLIEVRQPVEGRIANSVVRMCRLGIPELRLDTLFPGNPALVDDEFSHNIIYQYRQGRIVEQETPMCRDIVSGEDFMTHILVAVFEKFKVDTHEWVETALPTLVVNNP